MVTGFRHPVSLLAGPRLPLSPAHRLGRRTCNAHGDTGDLPNDLRAAPIFEPPDRASRLGVRHQPQFPAVEFAPAANISVVAHLDEIDRTIEFGRPSPVENLPLGWVDLHERTWANKVAHGVIVEPHQTIERLAGAEQTRQTDGNIAPNHGQLRKQIGLRQCLFLPESQREDHRFRFFFGLRQQAGLRHAVDGLVLGEVAHAQVEQRVEISPAPAIDGAEGVKSNIADSLQVVIQIERRPGRRYISEVLEINTYDPDADLFDYCAIYQRQEGPHD